MTAFIGRNDQQQFRFHRKPISPSTPERQEPVRPMCPHCGYNLAAERTVSDGPFRYEPGTGFLIDGERMNCNRQSHEVLGAVMMAAGRPISIDVLASRLGYGGDRPRVLVTSLLSYARRQVTEAGHNFPIETLRGVGLRWNRDAKPHGNCLPRVQ